jgi:hypothetical protein
MCKTDVWLPRYVEKMQLLGSQMGGWFTNVFDSSIVLIQLPGSDVSMSDIRAAHSCPDFFFDSTYCRNFTHTSPPLILVRTTIPYWRMGSMRLSIGVCG